MPDYPSVTYKTYCNPLIRAPFPIGCTDLKLDIYVPNGGGIYPPILLLPDGAWRACDTGSVTPLALRLRDEGMFAAVVVGYRPTIQGSPYTFGPAAKMDVLDAIAYVRAHQADWGIAARRLGVLGVGAGGTLAQMAGSVGAFGTTKPSAVVSWSGWSDLRQDDLDLTCFYLKGEPQIAGSPCRQRGDPPCTCATGNCSCTELGGESPIVAANVETVPTALFHATTELVPYYSQGRPMQQALDGLCIYSALYNMDEEQPRPRPAVRSRHGIEYADRAWGPTVAWFDQYVREPRPPTPF